jgi:hypothetical protein
MARRNGTMTAGLPTELIAAVRNVALPLKSAAKT